MTRPPRRPKEPPTYVIQLRPNLNVRLRDLRWDSRPTTPGTEVWQPEITEDS